MGVANTHLYVGLNYHEYKQVNHEHFMASFLNFSFFSLVLSIILLLNLNVIDKNLIINTTDMVNDSKRCVFDYLRESRVNNPKKVTLGHLNINSIPNKFEGIMGIVKNNLDVFLLSETKIDGTFPDSQFYFGYRKK